MVFPIYPQMTQGKTTHRKVYKIWPNKQGKLYIIIESRGVPWTARRSNQSILKGISPGCSLEGMMLKAETPVLWPPHAKSWLIGKDSDAGRDWGQEEKGTTEDEMAGCITDSMGVSLSELRELVTNRELWHAAIHGGRTVGHDWATELNWTERVPGSLVVKNLPEMQEMQETQVWFLSQEDLEKEMATHSSILACKIPSTEEPGGLHSVRSQRAGHDWALVHTHTHTQTHPHKGYIEVSCMLANIL